MRQTQVHVYVKGDVIGVGFRAWMKIQAKLTGVNGWVRNTFDRPKFFDRAGGVEAVLSGEEGAVKQLIAIIRKGSPIAQVDEVNVIHIEQKQEYKEFEIRATKHTAV